MESYAKYLSKTHGGKWKYDYESSWWCDDGKREVRRVCLLDDETPASRRYVMYDARNGAFLQYVEMPLKELKRFFGIKSHG